MAAQPLIPGTRLRWRETVYAVHRASADGQVSLENQTTGIILAVPRAEIVAALFAGDLVILPARIGPDTPPTPEYPTLADCPPHLAAIARYRLSVLEPLLPFAPRPGQARIAARVAEVQITQTAMDKTLAQSVSVVSVYRWWNDYMTGGNDVRALIPRTAARGGSGKSRLQSEVETIVDDVIRTRYLAREAITIDAVTQEIAVRINEANQALDVAHRLTMPGRSTVARRIDALDVREKVAARQGSAAARRLRQFDASDPPTMPLERVEIDHTRSDLIVLDERDNLPLGRLTLTYCLDVATRYPLGYYLGFEPASYLAVMECLYHAICPKPDVRERYHVAHDWLAYGVPATLVIDNGKEFIGQDLQDACLLLGIVLQRTPVRTPHFKGTIERSFRTLNTLLFHQLPGTTFSNPTQRGSYKSLEQACVYRNEVDAVLHQGLLDLYAEQFHRGLEGVPARRWEQAVAGGFSPRLPPNGDDPRVLLGRIAERVVQHYGIDFESLRYQSDELITLRTRQRGAPVRIKYHPGDLSQIYVYDSVEHRYIPVPAADQEYTANLSLWKHRVIRQTILDEKREVSLVALGAARRRIQDLMSQGQHRRRVGTRTQMARWDTAGRPTREPLPAAPPPTPAGRSPATSPPVAGLPPLPPAGLTDLTALLPPRTEAGVAEGWDITYAEEDPDPPK